MDQDKLPYKEDVLRFKFNRNISEILFYSKLDQKTFKLNINKAAEESKM